MCLYELWLGRVLCDCQELPIGPDHNHLLCWGCRLHADKLEDTPRLLVGHQDGSRRQLSRGQLRREAHKHLVLLQHVLLWLLGCMRHLHG